MKWVHMIKFSDKAFLAMPTRKHNIPNSEPKGWRPYSWTRNVAEAEKFTDPAHALMWGRNFIPHDDWKVVSLPVAGPAGSIA